MTATSLADLGIAELAAAIAGREASPVDAVEASLERIDRLNGTLNAFLSVYPDLALAAAREAEAEIMAGQHRGPLHGIPLGIKDLFQVEGMQRTCGSKIFNEQPGVSDATSVARLKAAGAVIVGLLNLNEFAYGPTGINPHHGSARNPWDQNSGCGGSSAGAGCAVAASLVPGAMGSDTGGSVRLPAGLCGVVGLKQTFGLASNHGIYPLCKSFDHGGPLTRSVRDAATMLQAIAGTDANDPKTAAARVEDYGAGLAGDINGLRIGVPSNFFFDDLHPDIESCVRDAIEVFTGLGAVVREVPVPFAADAVKSWTTMALAEAYAVHEDHVRDHPGEMGPEVEARLLLGRDITAQDYLKARDHQDEVRNLMAGLLTEVDALVMPTSPIPAVSIETGTVESRGREVDGAAELARLTRLAVFTGQPAISVPCGFTASGLPVGLQLAGKWHEDAELLKIADAYERATAWHERRPVLE